MEDKLSGNLIHRKPLGKDSSYDDDDTHVSNSHYRHQVKSDPATSADNKDGHRDRTLHHHHQSHAKGEPVGLGLDSDDKWHEQRHRIEEIQDDLDADDEFEALKRQPTAAQPGSMQPTVAQSQLARNFANGFKILSMNMRDALSGRLVWRSANWRSDDMFEREIVEEVPKQILLCRVVSREILFSSTEEMKRFRLEQRVFFHGNCIEEWFFTFGYVMAGSRNSWQQTIDAAPPEEMLPAEALSGNVVFKTSFFDGDLFLCKNSVRLYYV